MIYTKTKSKKKANSPYYNEYYKKKTHTFTVDACDKKRKIVKEFNGCFFHGCQKCYPQYVKRYNRTIERKTFLKHQGIK